MNIAASQTKPSTSSPPDVVELRPPADSGFSGTALILASDVALIAELKRRGYTVVDERRP